MTGMPDLDEDVEWAIGFVLKPDRRCGWTVIFKREEELGGERINARSGPDSVALPTR